MRNHYLLITCDKCKDHVHIDPQNPNDDARIASVRVAMGAHVKEIDLCISCLEILNAVLESWEKLDQSF